MSMFSYLVIVRKSKEKLLEFSKFLVNAIKKSQQVIFKILYYTLMRMIKLKSVDSTHLYALRLVEEHPTFSSISMSGKINVSDNMSGVVIVADEQTNGIGRCNRRWESLKGNLFTSIIMPMLTGFDLGQLSLTAACAIRETIAYYIPMSMQKSRNLTLHWPNDVYFQGKKISGMLLAVSNDFLIISIGINVNVSPKDCNVKRPTTCIREIIKPSSESSELHMLHINTLLCILLENIDKWISRLRKTGFSDIKSYWLRNINDINCSVTIKNGNSVLNGIFLDINDSGKAVLKVSGNNDNNKNVLISSGDLFLNQNEIVGYGCE